MKRRDFVKACRNKDDIEGQISKMSTREVIELRADLKRKMSGSSDWINLIIFEVSFFVALLTLIVSITRNNNGQDVAVAGAMVALVVFGMAIIGGVFSTRNKSSHAEALSYLDDYLQVNNRKSNNEIITEEYEQTCERYRREVEGIIVQWQQARENAEKQIELYKSLLAEPLVEKEEG